MPSLAIDIKNISKQYIIRHEMAAPSGSMKEVLGSVLGSVKHIFDHSPEIQKKEAFWALKDINLKIEHGESIGIIGRNGAGKSTLLKLLTRITRPSEGSILLYERVNSLLEIGAGFNSDLSGRDNVYLNGCFLGMKKAEIENKFDQIVDFSGIRKFIDTPVKYYSSGMYVRLAFSVAVHLEPETLLLDEVLAVGDASFQEKSYNKMKDLLTSGGLLFCLFPMMQMQ